VDISKLYELFLAHPVITTDSRDCPENSIFFALKGEKFNGNEWAESALQKGCAYAVVDQQQYAVYGDDRYILTDDVLTTLQKLANYHRNRLGTPVIGITGTNGKTTTKELVAAVLSKKFNVLYTQGNFNNHIGVPKTLLRLTEDNDIAVIEMGANHPGEIKTLVDIAEPDCGIITNVGKAHLEGFGSLEGVLKTKGELYDFLRNRNNSKVFINNDNSLLTSIADGLDLIRYGQDRDIKLNIRGEILGCDPFLEFQWKKKFGRWHEVKTHLIGEYNVDNCLAACTVGSYFGVPPKDICQALSDYCPSNSRSQYKETDANRLIIDAYNANPTSMRASINNFIQLNLPNKMVVLGDMKELGEASAEEHQKIIDILVGCDFDDVWIVGENFAATNHPDNFRSFADVNEVAEFLKENKPNDKTILIKGSNSTRLSSIVDML